MADRQFGSLVHHLRKALARQGSGGMDDAQLLELFVQRRDQAAFEVLVWRHGTMVLNVCRRVLRDAQEAEDAFQATFLILARKAATIGKGDSVPGWLYRVAYRVALRSQAQAARRCGCGPLPDEVPAAAADDLIWRDLRPVLDEEVNRLPEKYRVPFVLCYLEGHTNEEAARQLGCPRGTILSRLARGRERLQARLTRRGISLAVGGLATALAAEAEAVAPAGLVRATVGGAQAFVAGKAAGVVPAHILALTEGVLQAMLLTKIKVIGAAALAVILTATGAGLFAQREAARPAAAPPAVAARVRDGREGGDVRGILRAVDVAQNTVTLAGTPAGRDGNAVPDKTYSVSAEAGIFFDIGRRFITREGKLAELLPGAIVSLKLSADQKTVEAVLAEGPTIQGKLTAVDATKNTLTVATGAGRDGAAGEDKTYLLAKDAEVSIDDGRGRRLSVREARLGELPAGALVTVKLSPDQKEAVSVQAEGPGVQGVIKAVDAGKQTITLTTAATRRDQGAANEQTFTVAANAEVLVEDERPFHFYPVREAKLSDLPVGSIASLRLSPDQTTAMVVRAEGPSVSGALKGIDPTKGSVVIVIGSGRGTDAEERTYTVAKDARIWVDGAEAKLADLKAGDPAPNINLKLSLDQKTVRAIHMGGGRR